jgi:hypothetical protein
VEVRGVKADGRFVSGADAYAENDALTLVEDIYSLPPPEQAERFRALFEYLERQYMELVANYHMMVIPWSNQSVIDRINQSRRVQGFELVRSSLLDTCILAITKLLLDGDDTNPSLLTMVRPFLPKNRERHAELLTILESKYSDWGQVITEDERRNNPPEIIKLMAKINREDAQKRHAEFKERMNKVASDWPKLASESEKLRPIRNKWVAHFEVEYDASTKEYKPPPLPPLKEVYQLIKEVTPVITKSAFHLAGLFKNLDNNPDQWAGISRREAAKYWEIEQGEE